MRNHLDENEILQRFRHVGGVPRHIFDDTYKHILKNKNNAIKKLTLEQVKKITVQNISTVETQSENQPGSAILGYFKDENEISYKGYKVDIISDGVTMQIAIMFMNDLWGAMSNSPGGFNPNIF